MKNADYELEYDFLEASKKGTLAERIFHKLRIKNTLALIKGKNLNILDLGCGTGIFFEHLCRENNVVGIDVSLWCLQRAFEHAKKTRVMPKLLILGSISKVPLKQKKYFDLVLLIGVLEHLKFDFDNTLKNIHNLLKDKGKLIVSVPAKSYLNPLTNIVVYDFLRKILSRRRDIEKEGEHKHFTPKELINIFKGFKPLAIKKYAFGTELIILFEKLNNC